jgi:hypothetical protein
MIEERRIGKDAESSGRDPFKELSPHLTVRNATDHRKIESSYPNRSLKPKAMQELQHMKSDILSI